MFSGEMTFYHGTTDVAWENIKKDRFFVPKHDKDDGEYWTAKGVYFACNNPYIALWYAHFRCYLSDNEDAMAMVVKFKCKLPNTTSIINLLSDEGSRHLLKMHIGLKKIHAATVKAVSVHTNVDALALKHLPDALESDDVCVISSFQEGESYQTIVHGHRFQNKYISDRIGFCVGDNVSVCFLGSVSIDKLGEYEILRSDQLIALDKKESPEIFPIICQGLNNKLLAGSFAHSAREKRKPLREYFNEVCNGQ